MKQETCCQCKTVFWMSDDVYRIARERRERFEFYCPNGHPQHYVTGQSETDKLRQERDRLTQKLAEKDDEIKRQREMREHEERRVSAAKGQITRLKRRAKAGLCPCCNRTFSNMAAHMKTCHPNMDPNVVDMEVGKRKRA